MQKLDFPFTTNRKLCFVFQHIYLVEMIMDIFFKEMIMLDPSNGYSLGGVYHLLTSQPGQTTEAVLDLIWHRLDPLKVSVFAWRLFQNRLRRRTTCSLVVLFLSVTTLAWQAAAISRLFNICLYLVCTLQLFGSIFSPDWGYLQSSPIE